MHSTRATRSLKNLFAGYHEPTPLSRQTSQKLLDGLKSSFRDQLDREYGRSSSAPSPAAAELPPSPRRSAANHHLKTLLSNPLFSYEKETTSTLSAPAPTLKRDPMDVFDHAVSRGMMTLKAATGCLVAKQQQIQLDPSPASLASKTDSALRVVRWLRSSRPESDLDFLDNRPFVRALVPFLVSEGLDHLAWEWVARSADSSSESPVHEPGRQRASFLLAELVRVKSQPQNGNLDGAISTLLQAEASLHSSRLLSKILVAPWRSVSWLSTVESYRRTAPSEELFDAHVNTASRLETSLEVEKAHLHLYHPTHPDHKPAMQLFEDTQRVRDLLRRINPERASASKPRTMGLLQWTAVLGHDTVNFLTRSGRSQEAEHLTGLLQDGLASLFVQGLKPA